jgi:hypothetical protein
MMIQNSSMVNSVPAAWRAFCLWLSMGVYRTVWNCIATLYENNWVNLYIDRVEFPNGYIIEQHHLLDFDHEAVMALVENDEVSCCLSRSAAIPP